MKREIIDNITHNAQLKSYPDGSGTLLVSDRPIFREPGWEAVNPSGRASSDPQQGETLRGSEESTKAGSMVASLERARRRARAKVADYARCNEFKYFVTLTLDAVQVDRYDISAVIRRLNRWLDNGVRRSGLRYLLVPELHQDGAIHFHGLVNDALEMVDSGTIKLDGGKKPRKPRSKAQRAEWLDGGGHVVYNISEYKLGFSTAIELYGDYNKAITYVCKYIGKGTGKIGGRWYYSGGRLKEPEKSYLDIDNAEELLSLEDGKHSFTIPRLGAKCAKIEWNGA